MLAGLLEAIVGVGLVIKWKNPAIQAALLHGSGEVANTLRRLVERVPLVVVDPMELVRHMDRLMLDDGMGSPLWTELLSLSSKGQQPHLATVVAAVKQQTTMMVLQQSGVGDLDRLCRHAVSDDVLDWDERPADLVGSYAEGVKYNLRASAKLALQSTALFVRDSEDAAESHAEAWSEDDGVGRYISGFESYHARKELRGVARVRLAFDIGEEATTAVARLRDTAESLAGDTLYAPAEQGFVRSVDDAHSISVQIADVVSGYASARIATEGLAGVARRFGTLLINNQRLTIAEAEHWDSERAWHRRLFI